MSTATATSQTSYECEYHFSRPPKHICKRMRMTKLSHAATLVYLYILDYRNNKSKDRWTLPITDEEIMEALAFSQDVVRRARSELVQKGFLRQEQAKTKSGHLILGKRVFQILFDNAAKASPKPTKKVVEIRPSQCTKIIHPSGRKSSNPPSTPPPENVETARVSVEVDPGCKDTALDTDKDTLSHPVTGLAPGPEEITDGKKRERDDLVNLFYKTIKKSAPKARREQRRATRELNELIEDIATDERVPDVEHAREILIDAFGRVYKKTCPIWSYKIMMDTGYGSEAIEEAIQHAFTPIKSKSHPSAEPQRPLEGAETGVGATDTPIEGSEIGATESDGVTANSEQGSAPPSQAEIDAVLLETWSDERYAQWVEQMRLDAQYHRSQLIQCGAKSAPLSVAELQTIGDKLMEDKPQTDEEKLAWIHRRIGEREKVETPERAAPRRIPGAVRVDSKGYKTPEAYIEAYCEANVHRRLTRRELTALFRQVEGQLTQDEIEQIHADKRRLWEADKKAARWETGAGRAA